MESSLKEKEISTKRERDIGFSFLFHLRDMLEQKRESNEKELQERELKGKERERIEMGMLIQAGTVNNEETSDDNFIFMGNSALSEQQNESSTPGKDSDANRKLNCKDDLKNTAVDVRPSEISDTFIKVDH